jgi:hypothetical protein
MTTKTARNAVVIMAVAAMTVLAARDERVLAAGSRRLAAGLGLT